MESIKENWKKIDSYLQENFKSVFDDLNVGATISEIELTEQKLKVKFPESVKTSLMIHNGQKGSGKYNLIDGFKLLPLNEIIVAWEKWHEFLKTGNFDDVSNKSPKEVNNKFWDPFWIPITATEQNDNHCFDLNPTSSGKTGQIINIWQGMLDRDLISPNYEEWLDKFTNDLLNDNYDLLEDYDGLVIKD